MKKIAFILFLVISAGVIQAQQSDLIKYKSLFTINFIRYIAWPDEAKQGDFIIGVLKNSAIASQIKAQTTGKKIGFQNIVIKEFKSIEELSNCHLLYVDGNVNYNKNAELIASKINNKHAFIVTDSNGAISKGSMINFVIVDNQLKFEVSAENAEKSGLKLSSTLFSMNNAIKS